jgi:hypothetical protein
MSQVDFLPGAAPLQVIGQFRIDTQMTAPGHRAFYERAVSTLHLDAEGSNIERLS